MKLVELDFHVPFKEKENLKIVFIHTSSLLMNIAGRLSWVGASLLTAACSSGGGGPADGGTPDVCIAYAQSFAGFHGWSSAPAVAKDGAADGLHGLGPLRVYWNEKPPHGATSFPVCTIIVKETEEADVTQRTVFAMVKHGGDFNTANNGWEWFSLEDNADGGVTELWSGVVAPPGETYANQAIGDCNGCHAQAAANDYVWDTALQLSNF
jgi:hypothetical protein